MVSESRTSTVTMCGPIESWMNVSNSTLRGVLERDGGRVLRLVLIAIVIVVGVDPSEHGERSRRHVNDREAPDGIRALAMYTVLSGCETASTIAFGAGCPAGQSKMTPDIDLPAISGPVENTRLNPCLVGVTTQIGDSRKNLDGVRGVRLPVLVPAHGDARAMPADARCAIARRDEHERVQRAGARRPLRQHLVVLEIHFLRGDVARARVGSGLEELGRILVRRTTGRETLLRAGEEREESDQAPHSVLFLLASCSRRIVHSPSFVRSASTISGFARETKLSFARRCCERAELLLELCEIGADARALLFEVDETGEQHARLRSHRSGVRARQHLRAPARSR